MLTGDGQIPLRRLRLDTRRRLVALQPRLEVGLELGIDHAFSVRLEDVAQLLDVAPVLRHVEYPDVGEDDSRELAPGYLSMTLRRSPVTRDPGREIPRVPEPYRSDRRAERICST